MAKVLRSGDTAVTVFLFFYFILFYFIPPLPDKHKLPQLHAAADRRKATIAHYSGRLLMNLLIKYIFNYSQEGLGGGVTNGDNVMNNLLRSV